jgi:hypothetical protein
LAELPPSSSVTRLIVCAALAAIARPTSVEPVSAPQGGQRRELGGLQHDRVARGQRRHHLPGGDRQREVPRRDQRDDSERLAHRERLPAADGDRVGEHALRRAAQWRNVSSTMPISPRASEIGLPAFARLEQRELVDHRLDG